MKKIIMYLFFLILLASFASAGLVSGGVMDVTLLSQQPDPVEPGSLVEVRWKIENLGEKIDDIEFKILPEYPFSLLPEDDGIRTVGNLYGRQQGDDAVILYYKFRIDENAIEGTNDIKLEYKTKHQPNWNVLESYDIRIQTSDAILSVLSIETNPEVIAPGQKANIKIKLKNEADSLLKNIKIAWSPLTITSSSSAASSAIEELPFTPIGSTNEKTLYSLETKSEKEISFDVMVSPDAESRDYKVQLMLSYEDELGNDYSVDNVMGLVVGKTPDVSVSIETNSIITPDSQGEISIRFVNKDVMDIKFVNVELEEQDCYTILSPSHQYLGNIGSDDYETAEFNLYVEKSEECVNLPLMINYKDANNNEYKENMTLQLVLYSEQEAIQLGLKQKSNTFGWIITLVIVIGGFWLWRRYKKRKQNK